LSSDSFGTRSTLETAHGSVAYHRLEKLTESGVSDVSRLPFSIKVLLETLLRNENGVEVSRHDIEALARYNPLEPGSVEVPFQPGRVILQDFTGVPAVVDLAALRSAMAELGGDPRRINPRVPVDLVIDHSVQVDRFASPMALKDNAAIEFARNRERYSFLRWGQQAFERFRVVPPASGIVHQVNLEYLARVVDVRDGVAFPDSLVGTDSHTTMVNGLGVVGWGVGGIEAEAAMLGQPLYMLAPEVLGFKLTGALPEGTTATDLVLTVTQILREHGVVGRFVEFYGPGLSSITLPDRATIANMAPEYGATMGFFPVDEEVLRYLGATGRDEELVDLVERYCKEQGLFRADDTPTPRFKENLSLDLSRVWPSLAGPKRPQDRTPLSMMKETFSNDLRSDAKTRGFFVAEDRVGDRASITLGDREAELTHGSVAIAAITSCTNTSNPSVMLAAGLLARKAVQAGLSVPPHVKTSLAPGSKVVTEYLTRTGLMPFLERLGFHVVGYGCTTCIGNSGPLPGPVARAVEEHDLVLAGVLSGNRNFEGRINPHVRANYLASPPLVVAYALAGTVDINLTTEPVGAGSDGAVYLGDIWPSSAEIAELLSDAFDPETFRRVYSDIESSNDEWNAIPVSGGDLYQWDEASTYIQQPPFFVGMSREPAPIEPIEGARVLVKVGDSITTDHISPAGAIASDSPAGRYLVERGVEPRDFNSYGSRRGNDRVMTRGTFANIRLRNELAPGTEGGVTTHLPSGEVTTIFEAAGRYRQAGTPTVVLAGRDYGMGSSRDWAAKGTYLLGVRAVIAQSFERIHRSNLVGMGVLPLEVSGGDSVESLGLTGRESFTVAIDDQLRPHQDVLVTFVREDGSTGRFTVCARVDTPVEVEYYRNGGILHTVLRQMIRG
jgi:aconitate hydratase